ncbi:L-histidine N(alpha)-methyltransferase [Waterburya agarophytonicola K14]|uniref:L-histidine N(Alpha)-methyltransferase n=1 Tax=Waterburya agarophytonicola KI4 TaxID=2874699 RepID=A0A964FH67_9CYAN|nr:L-histidine N(alpha)-methyltransferase [Waterburya agarophytonicola]MCC0179695.1 L-histidine N(alpha)-methyltransferase [Waterburya agarophytonicola KI4]
MSTFSDSGNSKQDSVGKRLGIDYLLDIKAIEQDDAKDVISGLKNNPKSIPARYFYDQKGSQLFEQICALPEYYPTRTEASILEEYGVEIIELTKAIELVELGSGSSTKTRFLLDGYRDLDSPLYYTPIDFSGSMLQTTANNLLEEYPQLKIQGKVATYDRALKQLSTYYLGKRTIIFLGSSIGNFDKKECDRFIQRVTNALKPGDYFLLGIDLYAQRYPLGQKPVEILEAAYNDAQGITAAFNLNMLQHLNDRFQGNFNLDLFKHEAIYNTEQNQIEMYLISQASQSVNLKSLDLTIELKQEEKILTEISRKFDLQSMKEYLSKNQLNLVQTYSDSQQWFGLLLCQKAIN